MSNFDGTLIYIVGTETTALPYKYIAADSYQYTKSGQDLDSYRDANGVLHRNALSHTVAKIEWQTPPMRLRDFAKLMELFNSNFTNELERRVHVKYYDFNTDAYLEGDMYVPDFTPQIYSVDTSKKEMIIRPVRFALIEY